MARRTIRTDTRCVVDAIASRFQPVLMGAQAEAPSPRFGSGSPSQAGTTLGSPRAFSRVALAVLFVAATLVGFSASGPVPSAGAAGPGIYSSPDWLPLRGSHQVVCTNANGCADDYHGWWALDIRASRTDNIFAAGAGQVITAVKDQGGNCTDLTFPYDCPPGHNGNYVVIDHGNIGGVRTYSFYMHFTTVVVDRNAWVDENTALGTAGDSGPSSPGFVHLHFEVRRGGNSGRLNGVDWPLKACHGDRLVSYPSEFGGKTSWSQVTTNRFSVSSDGSACAGGAEPAHNPVGNLDAADRVPGGVRVAGWARDDNDPGTAIQVQALVDGNPVGAAVAASNPRGDVGSHGFSFDVGMDDGPHQVCVKAFNIEGGSDVVLPGCVQVPQLWHDPEGHLDSATRIDGGHVRMRGWASDADVPNEAIGVQALFNGAVVGQSTANVGDHGFDFVVTTDWRSYQACAKGLNGGGGGVDVILSGCTTVPYAICPDTDPTLVSTKAKDDILPTSGDDVIWASGGGARIAGSAGNDIICGGGATGGPGGNQIIGGPGDNLIFTGPGNNEVVAGPGRTTVVSGGGHNRIAVCPNTVVLNRSAEDEVMPSGNCGPRPAAAAAAVTTTTTTLVPSVTTPATLPVSAGPTSTTAAPTPTTVPTPATTVPAAAAGSAVPRCDTGSQARSTYEVTGVGADGLAVRSGPSPYHPASYSVAEGSTLTVVCYVDSVAVGGNTRWDRLSDGLWVADAYLDTPKS